MRFSYQAMTLDGRLVSDVLDAAGQTDAVDALRARGLMILKLSEAAMGAGAAPGLRLPRRGAGRRDLMLFARQMKMMLEAGSSVVPALAAARDQTASGTLRAALDRMHEAVESGETLSHAINREHRLFDPVIRSLIAAGDATATLPASFGRVCALLEQQVQVNKMLVGAMIYPAVLCGLISVVLMIMLFFIVPRFKGLFASMHAPIPASTKLLFIASEAGVRGWPVIVPAVIVVVVGAAAALRSARVRPMLDEAAIRLPFLGRLMMRIMLARVLRIWAALLRCRVPLLETIAQSREAVTNGRVVAMLRKIESIVEAGGRVGPAIGAAGLADPIIVSALQVGEDNGRLAEATEFVSAWLDDDNATVIQQLTRMAEPALLSVMGMVVGFVALSLFVPLFDMATLAKR